MLRLSLRCIDRPRAVIALFIVLVVLCAPGLLDLELRMDGRSLVPRDDPAVRADTAIRKTFSIGDEIVVFVESPEPGGILDTTSLELVRAITIAIYRFEEVDILHIMSLGSEGRDRLESFDYAPFLFPLPASDEEIASLRADIDAASLLVGTLVAPDYSAAAILVQVPQGVDRADFYGRVKDTVDAIEPGDDQVHVVGAPVAEVLLGRHLLTDLAMLIPICVVLIGAGLLWAFRRPAAIVLVLSNVGFTLVFTFGLMGWLDQPVYMTTAVLPVILTTLGVASEIHLLSVAQRVANGLSGNSGRLLARRVMCELHRPVVLTALTTAIGFLSFMASELPPVSSFGLWASIGTVFSLAWSICVTPAAYRLLEPQRLRSERSEPATLRRVLARLDRWGKIAWTRYIAAAILLLLAAGAFRLQIQDGWISGFERRSEFRQSVETVNRSLLGTHLLQVHLDFQGNSSPDDVAAFLDPEVIDAIGVLERELRKEPAIGGVIGPYSQLATTAFLASGRRSGSDHPPDDTEGLRRLWRRLELGRGVHRRQQVVTDAMDQGVVTLFLKDANYVDTARIMDKARSLMAGTLSNHHVRIHFAGDVAVSQAMITSNVRGQLLSIGFGLVSLLLFLIVVLRNVGQALFCIVPVTTACVAVLGLMGWLGIPLGVATSMFIAITLGIGVDFPLHLLERIRRERRSNMVNPISAAKAIVGPAIAIDTLVISIGFGILVFSQVPANARLGALVAVSILVCSICTLMLLGDRSNARPRR